LAGLQALTSASVNAAAASMIALFQRAQSGRGQHVDISLQETVASVSHICGVPKWMDDGIIPRRRGPGLFASVPSGTYPCRDGVVYLMINRPSHWKTLARWIHEVTGNREVLDPMFDGPSANRIEYRELLDLFLSEFTAHFSAAQLYHEGQQRHLAITPVSRAMDVIHDEHLHGRGYFTAVESPLGETLPIPGAPFRLSRTPWRISRRAPRRGEHDGEDFHAVQEAGKNTRPRPARDKPDPAATATFPALRGIRVLEFTAAMAGPWVGRFMAYCGAEVIRVESKNHPDVVRQYISPRNPELGTQPQLSPWFTEWNAGKSFVALDLMHPEAVGLAHALVKHCDVVVEHYSSGVMEKLGLGYPDLAKGKPDLVMLSTSGYGARGPCHRYITWGPNIEALSGLSRLSGFDGRECTMTQFAYPDGLSALHGLFAVMCALDHRRRTGEGQHIDLSQLETTTSALGPLLLEALVNQHDPRKLGNRSAENAHEGCYRCLGEDRWCVIRVASEPEWQALCKVAEREDWLQDPRFATAASRQIHADALDSRIEQWTRTHAPEEIMRTLQAHEIAAGVVQNTEDLSHDPQLTARGFFEEVEHVKKGATLATGIPLGLRDPPGRSGRAGAALGQDNQQVFGQLLGLSPEEIERLTRIGAIEPAET